MFNRFDANARTIFALAGNLAARRRREQQQQGDHFVQGVEITVGDLREALRLVVDESGWQGGPNAALSKRLGTLPKRGPIGAEQLRKALR